MSKLPAADDPESSPLWGCCWFPPVMAIVGLLSGAMLGNEWGSQHLAIAAQDLSLDGPGVGLALMGEWLDRTMISAMAGGVLGLLISILFLWQTNLFFRWLVRQYPPK